MIRELLNKSLSLSLTEELEITDTTDAQKWANYLDLGLEFDKDEKLYQFTHDSMELDEDGKVHTTL